MPSNRLSSSSMHLPGELRAAWRKSDGKRIEHPARGGAVAREDRLRLER